MPRKKLPTKPVAVDEVDIARALKSEEILSKAEKILGMSGLEFLANLARSTDDDAVAKACAVEIADRRSPKLRSLEIPGQEQAPQRVELNINLGEKDATERTVLQRPSELDERQ